MTLIIPISELFSKEVGLLSKHKSWERIELGRVSNIINGFPFTSELFSNKGGFPLARIRDVERGFTKTFYKGDFENTQVIKKGDLLVSMDGNFICAEWKDKPALLNQRVCKIVTDERYLNKKLFAYGIQGYLTAIQNATSSLTVAHLSSLDLAKIPFPLPPIKEQTRLAEEIEKQFSRLDEAVGALRRIQANLKRYRQSVLKAAVEGRLVPTEAELAKKEKRDFEPADKLMERILKERRKKWEKKDFNNKAKYKEPRPPITSDLPELPEGWTWATNEQISDSTRAITYGVIKLGIEVENGVPTLRSSNVRNLFLDLEYVKSISPSIARNFKRTFLEGGEILVTVRGTLGGVVVVPNNCKGFNISSRLLKNLPRLAYFHFIAAYN